MNNINNTKFTEGNIPWNKGLKYALTDDHKKNISKGLIGNKYRLGTKHSEETLQKFKNRKTWNKGTTGLIKPNKGSFQKGVMIAEKNINWKGGVTPEHEKIRKSPEYVEWRKNVFQRDHFTCVNCGDKQRKIIADHIKPFFFFPELRLDVSNGRTLCKQCDKKIAFNYERDKHKYLKIAG